MKYKNRETVLCGYWCLYYLNERQEGKSILDVIHNEEFLFKILLDQQWINCRHV